MTKVITVTGVVKEFQWVNPHTWLHLTVDDGKGGTVEWMAEGRAPGILLRAGWTKNSLKGGETVSVDMSPAKNGRPEGDHRAGNQGRWNHPFQSAGARVISRQSTVIRHRRPLKGVTPKCARSSC